MPQVVDQRNTERRARSRLGFVDHLYLDGDIAVTRICAELVVGWIDGIVDANDPKAKWCAILLLD